MTDSQATTSLLNWIRRRRGICSTIL
jgi:hypothetical protein